MVRFFVCADDPVELGSAAGILAEPRGRERGSFGTMKRMRTRTLVIVLVGLILGPALLFYGVSRTSLYGVMIRLFGKHTVLVIGVLLLTVLIVAALLSLVYGFLEDHGSPLRRRRKANGEP